MAGGPPGYRSTGGTVPGRRTAGYGGVYPGRVHARVHTRPGHVPHLDSVSVRYMTSSRLRLDSVMSRHRLTELSSQITSI